MDTEAFLKCVENYRTTIKSSTSQKGIKPSWRMVSLTMLEHINKAWREKGYKELDIGQWQSLIKGHNVFWLSEVFLDCYSKDKGFNSYKCWKIIKEHQIKKEKKPKNLTLI